MLERQTAFCVVYKKSHLSLHFVFCSVFHLCKMKTNEAVVVCNTFKNDKNGTM